jgi:16S rRNA (cytosine967-C5)-methyltransferase
MSRPRTARQLAVAALRDRAGSVSAHLDRLLAQADIAPAERALARELAMGVVRRRGMLQAVLERYLARPNLRLPGATREILLVAIYQLLLLGGVPDYAAVSEAVNQVRAAGQPRQAGLVNGVLRAILRDIGEEVQQVPPRRPDVIPLGPTRYRPVARAVFADPAEDAAAWLAQAHSLGSQLARRWIANFGLDVAVEIATCSASRPPLVCRVDSCRSSVAEVVESLAAEGVTARPHVNGLSIVLEHGVNITSLGAFQAGLIQPQDATATAAALAARPAGGSAVMDFCAAPGTKTMHLAELMNRQGRILAVDVSDDKLARVRESAQRLGVEIVETQLAEAVGGIEPGSFDVVLADVPCSNTGVLARRPEARWRFSEEALKKIVADQQFLLRTASTFVRPGGRLVYSTCSIEPEECGQMARWAQARSGRLRLAGEKLTLPRGADDPTRWQDGGYWAAFNVT